jgi:hypothetical protein
MLKGKMNGGGGGSAKAAKKNEQVAPAQRGLSALDKFDKRIKVRKVEKEVKPAARAYNARLRAKK